jgi:nucleoside-diphosphate-sugar epimerase
MQCILGAGGAIGVALAKSLPSYTDQIRLVSRNPEKVNANDELFKADLLSPEQLAEAVKGAEIVYVTVGFPYRHKVWADMWPSLMDPLIELCEQNKFKLVFFDNVYLYDPSCIGHMTEDCAINPSSKKGQVRASIAEKIMKAAQEGRIKACIARSADFYGPSIQNTSVLTETVFKPLSEGKTANWLMNDGFKHAFTYTPDAGKATALLGNSDKAYGQVWHLPTAKDALTGKEWVSQIAKAMGKPAKHRVVSKSMVKLLGLFSPVMKESVEMLYQYDRDYVFDSSKFEEAFDLKPTSYAHGINEIVKENY